MSRDGDDTAPESIPCEDVTDEIVAAFASQGYALTFAEDVMRCDLTDTVRTLPRIDSPVAVDYREWTPERAHDFFAVYAAAFRERPGFPGWSEAEWVHWTAGDPTFRPDLSVLAVIQAQGDQAVGFITSADSEEVQPRSGFVIQVGVHPEWRGRKLGAALMIHALGAWRDAGKEAVLLDVKRARRGFPFSSKELPRNRSASLPFRTTGQRMDLYADYSHCKTEAADHS